MKTRFLIMFVVCLLSLALIPDSKAEREILTVDELSKKSDAIAIGIIESTWIDIRLFDDYPIVDTAKIKVDDWFKNDKNSDILEIRYYGYWAKTIDDLRGKFIWDNPHFNFESGQKVLLILDHEENTSVMGGGYYPLFEGSFVIDGDDVISHSGKQTTLRQLYNTINSNLDVSQEQRLDNILKICEKFGPQPDEKTIQSANKTHYINNQECQWHERSKSTISLDRTVYPDPQFCADEFDKMYLKAAAIPCGCCNPPPGEPVCEPVPIEGHIRDMIVEEFKPCISTIDRWTSLADNNGFVWYAFGTNYVKLKMEKTNHEEIIPIFITFSGYSQCLNDFHLIVKEHIGDRKVVFEEKYSQVCDDSKPNNEFKTYREISLDGVGKPIILSKGHYLVELYTDTPQMHGSNYVDKVYFSSHFQ